MRIRIISIFLIFSALFLVSNSFDEMNLTPEESTLLSEGEPVYRFYGKNEAPRFRPDLAPDRKYSLGLECLSILERPEHLSDLDLFNALLKVEGMQGIEYYSSTSRRIKVLFEESYTINPETRQKIAPISVDAIPESLSISIMQNDATFGKVYSTVSYQTDSNGFYVEMQNTSPLKVLLFNVADAQDMRIAFTVIPDGDQLLLYAHCNVFTPDPIGLIHLNRNSFLHRVKALFTWLQAEIL